jgi:hypothetical protein
MLDGCLAGHKNWSCHVQGPGGGIYTAMQYCTIAVTYVSYLLCGRREKEKERN